MEAKTYPLQSGSRFCPICQASKKKSTVRFSAADERTNKEPQAGYWDEAGKYVYPTPVNTLTCTYLCSLGHSWKETGACY